MVTRNVFLMIFKIVNDCDHTKQDYSNAIKVKDYRHVSNQIIEKRLNKKNQAVRNTD